MSCMLINLGTHILHIPSTLVPITNFLFYYVFLSYISASLDVHTTIVGPRAYVTQAKQPIPVTWLYLT
jgi:hypothetical protein